MGNMTNRLGVAALCAGMGMSALAAPAVTTIDVSAGGALATPVALHVDSGFASWLASANWYEFASYGVAGTEVRNAQPLVRLVWGEAGRELVYTNLCAGATYEWEVVRNDGTKLAGSFTTEAAAPRVVTVPVANGAEVWNTRDVGGWPLMGTTRGGLTATRQGVYFRGGNLDDFYDGEQLGSLSAGNWWAGHADQGEAVRAANLLHAQLGVKSVLDLRRAVVDGSDNPVKIFAESANPEDERFYYPAPLASYPYYGAVSEQDGVKTFTGSPACPDMRLFITPMASGDLAYTEQLRRVFHVLGTPGNLPAYFHCRVGRDRTGLVAFLLNALCGVDEPSLYRDYLTSCFAYAGGTVDGSALDTNIRYMYRGWMSGGTLNWADPTKGECSYAYGKSLAGHVRAYLEYIGVTASELATITQALTGETPDEVLARVDAYEQSRDYRDYYYVNDFSGATNATHRVPFGGTFPPPAMTLARTGFTFMGWKAPELQADGAYVSNPDWRARWRVCFLDAFGGLLGSTDVYDGGSASGLEPAAPRGAKIVGWDVDYTCVTSNMIVRAVMEGDAGWLGTTGEEETDEAVLARGGDSVRRIERESTIVYVHVFTDTARAQAFVNNTGSDLQVSYLVVGGGGAGGDQYTGSSGAWSEYLELGAAGGGGGGVVGRSATVPAGATWTVRVGAGGRSPLNRYNVRIPAGASSISNGTEEVACAPGGGGGGSGSSNSSVRPGQVGQAGAAGGGGHCYCTTNGCMFAAGAGTFASTCDGEIYGVHPGGACIAYVYDGMVTGPSGGGGGAGSNAVEPFRGRVGSGGRGVYSSITGVLGCYGAGGGAGGGTSDSWSWVFNCNYAARLAACGLPNGVAEGFGGSNGGRGGYHWEGVWTVPEAGCDGFGGGGGGATWNGGVATAGADKESSAGGDGGSGVVVIRYSVMKSAGVAYEPGYEGNAGEVTFTGFVPEVALDALGNVCIKPGTTATLSATDAGGRVVGAWRDESTGRMIWGETVEVTPETFTRYTACFGCIWVWDSSKLTLSEDGPAGDRWVFQAEKRDGNNLAITNVVQARADGYLNLATPVFTVANGGSLTTYQVFKLGAGMFAGRDYPKTLVLSGGGARIERGCFQNNTGLRGVLCLPANVSLRSYAFDHCSTLEGVVFADLERGQAEFAGNGRQFYYTTGLRGAFETPRGVTRIPQHFLRHSGISSASFPGVESFGTEAVSACANLTNLVLSESLTLVEGNAFRENAALHTVRPFFPAALKNVWSGAFSGCTALGGDAVMDGVENLETNAFWGVAFTSLSLASCTNIQYRALYSAPLTNVVFGAGALHFHGGVDRQFYSCAPGCRFWFPGKAPVFPPTREIGGVDVHAICDHGIFGNSAAGSTKFPRLYGRWMKDRKGWEKILADVGYPLAEVRDELVVPAVEQGQRVKGAFKWVYSVDKPVIETMWGWLIDYGPSGFTTLVVR